MSHHKKNQIFLMQIEGGPAIFIIQRKFRDLQIMEEIKDDDYTAFVEEKEKVTEKVLLRWWKVKKFLLAVGRQRSGKFGPRARVKSN